MLWKIESTDCGNKWDRVIKKYPMLTQYGAFCDENNEVSISFMRLETLIDLYNLVHELDDFNEIIITENLDHKPTIEIYDDWRE